MLVRALFKTYMQKQDWGYIEIFVIYSRSVWGSGIVNKKNNKKTLQILNYLGLKKELCIALAAKLSKAAIQWHYTENILKKVSRMLQ